MFYAREPLHTLWSTHRYFSFSFIGVSLFWAISFYLLIYNSSKKFSIIFKFLSICLVASFLFFSIKYQQEFNNRRSIPAKDFFHKFTSAVPKLKKGDVLQVKGASGNFSFHENNPEQWFIGAGTGVVPLYSMIKEYLPQYPQKKFRLFFGLRSKKDLFLVQELDQLKKRYTHFDYLITLSREKWDGPQGWVQKHLGTELIHKNFYICGRKELAFDTKAYLVKHKVEEKNIYFEAY